MAKEGFEARHGRQAQHLEVGHLHDGLDDRVFKAVECSTLPSVQRSSFVRLGQLLPISLIVAAFGRPSPYRESAVSCDPTALMHALIAVSGVDCDIAHRRVALSRSRSNIHTVAVIMKLQMSAARQLPDAHLAIKAKALHNWSFGNEDVHKMRGGTSDRIVFVAAQLRVQASRQRTASRQSSALAT